MTFLASLSSWAVDLGETGAVYPWQGMEKLMVLVGVVLWLGWHVWQIKSENKILADEDAHVRALKEVAQEGVDHQD